MTDRIVTVKIAGSAEEFLLLKFSGEERLGRLFRYDVDLATLAKNIKLDDLLGQSITVAVELPDDTKRYFNGLISEVAYQGGRGGYGLFRVTMRPWLWQLTRASDNRIFQEMTAVDIFEKVCKDGHGFSDYSRKLSESYDKRTYCVQYGESDFDFVSRLMEEEGIYYFFEHVDGKHTLVLADAASSHRPIAADSTIPYRPAAEAAVGVDHVFQWSKSHSLQPQAVTFASFDYEKPNADLAVKAIDQAGDTYRFEQELYEYGTLYQETSRGESLAKAKVTAHAADFAIASGVTTVRTATCGATFSLSDYPLASENREYLLVAADYRMTTGDVPVLHQDAEDSFECSFSAIDSQRQFRSKRLTQKSLVRGPQTAMVVGKEDEEIWTDEHGRIKVQFHWDRNGKEDENSSCWVRVSQGWAGNGWGMMALPRIGQEVIVSFLEGDPDQPIVTGCVYNAVNKPPFKLPDNKTQSGIRTRSAGKGDVQTFNELRFEDKKDEEEVYFHAQRDFKRVVENNDVLTVGLEGKDKGEQTIEIQSNRTVTLHDGNDSLTLENGNQDIELQNGDQAVKLANGDQTVTLENGDQKIDVKKKIDIKAGDQLTITVGMAKLIMKKNGDITLEGKSINIKGKQAVKIKAAAQAEMKGAQTKVEGTAMLDLKGGAMAKLKGGITMIG